MNKENDLNHKESTISQEGVTKILSVILGMFKGTKSGWVKDFISFKIMIVPKILAFLYLLITIIVIIASFSANIFFGILMIFLAPFLVHIVFEFAMLLFAILDILREIRNKLIPQYLHRGNL